MEYLACLVDDRFLTTLSALDVDDPKAWKNLVKDVTSRGRLTFGGSTDELSWEILKDYFEETVGYRAFEGDIDLDESIGEFVSWIVHAEAFEDAATELGDLQPETDPAFVDAFATQMEAMGLEVADAEVQKQAALAMYKDVIKVLSEGSRGKHLIVLVPF